MSDNHMAAAVEKKDAGNAAFAAGDIDACLALYAHGLAELEAVPAAEAATLRAILHCNSANALLAAKRHGEAVGAATRAIAAIPKPSIPNHIPSTTELNLIDKARLRRATAEHEDGYHFAALLDLLQIGGAATRDAAAELKQSVARKVGLCSIDAAFGVEPYAGGLTAVALDDVPIGTEFFAEAQLLLAINAAQEELQTDDSPPLSTERRVRLFVDELLPLRCSTSAEDVERYDRVRRELRGSWPRRVSDIDARTLASVEAAVAEAFESAIAATPQVAEVLKSPAVRREDGDISAEEAEARTVRDEILLLALQGRYNCFHRGFFRACALLNHSCDANAAMKYTPGRSVGFHSMLLGEAPVGMVSLVACRPIRRGEQITVKYLGDFDFLLGVLPRRDLLAASWLFTCACGRCRSDLEPGAANEWLRCTATPRCSGHVHLPVAPPDAGSAAAVGADADWRTRRCPECGRDAAVTPEVQAELHAVRLGALNVLQQVVSSSSGGTVSAPVLHERVLELRRRAAAHVHPAHWLHTVCIYQFCVGLQRRIDEVFTLVAEGRLSADVAAAQFGLFEYLPVPHPDASLADAAQEPRDAIDAIGLHVDLERRLKPFYPADQLWALHVAIGRLAVLLAVASAERFDDAAVLIIAKAPQFPRPLAKAAAALLTAKAGVPAKQLKAVLKALK